MGRTPFTYAFDVYKAWQAGESGALGQLASRYRANYENGVDPSAEKRPSKPIINPLFSIAVIEAEPKSRI